MPFDSCLFTCKNDNVRKSQISGLYSNKVAREKNSSLAKDKSELARVGYYVGRKIDSGTFAVVRYAERTSVGGSVPLAVKVKIRFLFFSRSDMKKGLYSISVLELVLLQNVLTF